MHKRKIILLASGTKDGTGGKLAREIRRYIGFENPYAEIVGIVSNRNDGAVARLAKERHLPFQYYGNDELTPEVYDGIPARFRAEGALVVLVGWNQLVYMRRVRKYHPSIEKILDRILPERLGLEPENTIVTHPALLSQLDGRFGGKGMWGIHVHRAVKKALDGGELDEEVESNNVTSVVSEKGAEPEPPSTKVVSARSGFTVFFPTEKYDTGITLAESHVPIKRSMSAEDIEARVKASERQWVPTIVEMVARGHIRLERGKVIVPHGYGLLPK